MEANIVEQIVQFANANINIIVIILLMGIGYCIKRIKALEKIDNSLIPVILIVCGIILCIIDFAIKGFDKTTVLQVIASGVANGAIAVGLNQNGKTLAGLMGKEETTTPPTEE